MCVSMLSIVNITICLSGLHFCFWRSTSRSPYCSSSLYNRLFPRCGDVHSEDTVLPLCSSTIKSSFWFRICTCARFSWYNTIEWVEEEERNKLIQVLRSEIICFPFNIRMWPLSNVPPRAYQLFGCLPSSEIRDRNLLYLPIWFSWDDVFPYVSHSYLIADCVCPTHCFLMVCGASNKFMFVVLLPPTTILTT